MAVATPAAPVSILEGPLPLPPSHSLLQSVRVIEDDMRAVAGGGTVWAYPFQLASLWAPCAIGGPKDFDTQFNTAPFQPFGVYLPVRCTTLDTTEEELRQMATAVFEAVESEAVEREFATGEIQPSNITLQNINPYVVAGGAAVNAMAGLALLEREIGTQTGRRGVLHADPGVASLWANYGGVQEVDGVLLTRANGNLVISGAGYAGATPGNDSDAGPTEGWAFATGPVEVRRTPEAVLFSVDQKTNDAVALVERNYLVTWDAQFAAAALIDLTA